MKPNEIKILVVDDDAGVARGTAHLLERAGYSTATAANGAEALQGMSAFHPDLVLSDRDMPEMDGMDDYISKPMRLTELRAALERVGSQRQSQPQP